MNRSPGTAARARYRRGVAAALAVLALAGGCGVPEQTQAQPLPNEALPPLPVPSEATSSARRVTLYFVSGRGLVDVSEPLVDRSVNGVMAALAAGPPDELKDELRTLLVDPLSGGVLLVVSDVTPDGQVTLQTTPAYALVPSFDQMLTIGQVVHSLNEIGVSSVQLIDPAGNPALVPLPDGLVKEGAATAKDYASLLD